MDAMAQDPGKITPHVVTCPNEEEIRRLAYVIYEQRVREDGRDIDWLRAEAELTAPVIKTAA
jgi:Protein of unknown function (DUF2934)